MAERRYELDWLRVLAVLLLIYFHSARVFDEWEFYVKNPAFNEGLGAFVAFVDLWFMPLFFFIAGASTYFALRKRNGGEYLKERARRLLVPYVFGTLVISAQQVWCVFLQNPDLPHSYAGYYKYIFTHAPFTEVTGKVVNGVTTRAETLEPAHLWFILYLFIFSAVCLPLFLWLKGEKGQRFVDRLARLFSHGIANFLLALPIVGYDILPDMDTAVYRLFHVFPFIYGYILYSDKRLQRTLDRNRFMALVLALVCTAAYITAYLTGNMEIHYDGLAYLLMASARAFATWFWLIAIVGYGRKYLQRDNNVLRYASRGSYPFYILHQTVIVLLAYEVVQWNAGVAWKYAFLTTASLGITLLAYDVLVRRTRPTRFLFGMK